MIAESHLYCAALNPNGRNACNRMPNHQGPHSVTHNRVVDDVWREEAFYSYVIQEEP